jgi:adenosylhomocysteine nucleosidase
MIVAIAAEEREFAGLLRHASARRALALPVRFACQSTIEGREWILAAHGPGPALAAFAAEAALGAVTRPAAVVSTGLCGGLNPALAAAAVFVAREVRSSSGSWPCHIPSSPRASRQGLLWSQDRVATSIREKAGLFAGGCDAVEMEAAAVAQAALRHASPFFCIRAVSDDAGHEMPFDFNHYRDAEGRFNTRAVARAALMRPARVPALLALARRSARAGNLLGDFLADCQFDV